MHPNRVAAVPVDEVSLDRTKIWELLQRPAQKVSSLLKPMRRVRVRAYTNGYNAMCGIGCEDTRLF